MLVNICVKLRGDNLNGFKVTERTRLNRQMHCILFSVSKDHHSKNRKYRFTGSARRLMLVDICVKFQEDSLNSV